MPVEGYDSATYVKNNYEKLKNLIKEMQKGLLLDLIRRFQIRAGVKEDKSREYVTASASEGWIEVTYEGNVLDAVHISTALKYLRPAIFESKLSTKKKPELRFDSETMSNKVMQEEEDESATEYIQRKRAEKLRKAIDRKLGGI